MDKRLEKFFAGYPQNIQETDEVRIYLSGLPDEEFERSFFFLCNSDDARSQDVRNWLISATRTRLERRIPSVAIDENMSAQDFLEKIKEHSGGQTRVSHPMSQFLLNGSPSIEQVRYFVLHNWYRVRSFYRLVGQLAQRMPLRGLNVIYENLFTESGSHEGFEAAHPKLFERILTELHLPIEYNSVPDLNEGLVYLNNRESCFRSPDYIWGLAVFYAIESTSSNFAHIAASLSRHGISKSALEFYELHSGVDAEHERELSELVEQTVTKRTDRQNFLAALKHHQQCTRNYYDAIWVQVQNQKFNAPEMKDAV